MSTTSGLPSQTFLRLPSQWRQAEIGFVVLTHAALMMYMAFLRADMSQRTKCGIAFASTVSLACFVSFECLRTPSAMLSRLGAIYLFVGWFRVVAILYSWNFSDEVADVMDVTFFWTLYLRILLAERAFGSCLGAGFMAAIAAAVMLHIISSYCCLMPYSYYFVGTCYCLTAAIGSSVFACFWFASHPGLAPKDSYLQAEAKWVRAVSCRAAAAMFVTPTYVGVGNIVYGVCPEAETFCFCGFFYTEWAVSLLASPLLNVLEFFSLALMCGYLQPLRPVIKTSGPSRSSAASFKESPDRSHAWHATTMTLATRSIDALALLEFYGTLGLLEGPMPHYDPSQHTTNDVVRQAVVPMTRAPQGGVAYGTLLARENSGITAMPECMVTHTWSNLFLDLVAAVAAEALEFDDYASLAAQLAQDGPNACIELARSLQDSGRAHRSYWICAFCVNQHASICGGFGRAPPEGTAAYLRWDSGRRDTVTREVFSVCHCEEPKRFNHNFPDESELNKFDDMMALLKDHKPGFCQLAAVDKHFEVFERVWCVAEFVQAYVSRIPQRVCLYSSTVLDLENKDLSLYVKLATLTVAECKSSREEDKAEILSKIPCIDEFDSQLQATIFGQRGLLSKTLVGFDLIDGATRSARRVIAAGRRLRERQVLECL